MIKINLSSSPKQLDISNIGGFDFSRVKIVWVALAVILLYVPEWFVAPMWEESEQARNAELDLEKKKLSNLKRSVGELDKEEKQIKELKIQEENLKKKLTAVNEAISQKKNPMNLMLYLSKNIPDELWIRDLKLNDDTMVVQGEAASYVSVGNFVANLRASIFIKDAHIVSTSNAVRESDKKRVEKFEVKFIIARFE